MPRCGVMSGRRKNIPERRYAFNSQAASANDTDLLFFPPSTGWLLDYVRAGMTAQYNPRTA